MNKVVKIVIAVVIVALLAFGGITLLKKRKAQLAKLPSPEPPVYVVKSFKVKEGAVKVSKDFIGKLEADKQVNISTKFPGYIKKIYVSEGDKVKKGQILALIDDVPLKKEIQNLKLNIDVLKSQLKALNIQKEAAASAVSTYEKIYLRDKKLYQKKAIPKEKLELSYTKYKETQARYNQVVAKIKEVKAKIKQTENQIAIKENNLSYLDIKSPVDGVVDRVFLKEGNFAPNGKPVLTLHTTKNYKIIVSVPENLSVKKGTKAVLKFESRSVLSEVNKVYPSTDKNSLKVIEIRVNNIPENIKVGSLVNLSLILEEKEGLVVPNNAILHLSNGDFVLTLKDGRFVKIPVKVIASDEKYSLIQGNISKGTPVAVAEENKLRILAFGKRGKFMEGEK